MPKQLPNISGSECVAALEKAGFHFVRRSRGTHFFMQRDDPFAAVAVPAHRELGRGVLRSIIRDAGLTVDQFVDLL
ncbi:MAG: type II toxin-antitoxin system HicA family toxin [Aggregatilineales bacterium]